MNRLENHKMDEIGTLERIWFTLTRFLEMWNVPGTMSFSNNLLLHLSLAVENGTLCYKNYATLLPLRAKTHLCSKQKSWLIIQKFTVRLLFVFHGFKANFVGKRRRLSLLENHWDNPLLKNCILKCSKWLRNVKSSRYLNFISQKFFAGCP